MAKNNLALLQRNLRYLGFGEALPFDDQLAAEVERNNDEFELTTEVHFDEWSLLKATLYFRKAGQQGMFFLIKYTADLQYFDDSHLNRKQTFYIYKGSGITLKEGYNLLQGRAVYKDLTGDDCEQYQAWVQLDSNSTTIMNNYRMPQFRSKHGYDLEKTLSMYPIRELKDADLKANLIRSLKKGNLHPVAFEKGDKVEKKFIAANPQFKTITICSEAVRQLPIKIKEVKDEKESNRGHL